MQVRKVFSCKKLLQEGFANVEVLYLTDDPTTAILMEDFLDQKEERESQALTPPSLAYFAVIYSVAAILIGTSIFGAILAIHRLDDDVELYGWISLAVGVVLLYPCARLLYRSVAYVYSLSAPFSERPGVILRGKRLYWTNQCLCVNPSEIFNNDDDKKDTQRKSVELSELQVPTIDHNKRDKNAGITPQHLLFPNAGKIVLNRVVVPALLHSLCRRRQRHMLQLFLLYRSLSIRRLFKTLCHASFNY